MKKVILMALVTVASTFAFAAVPTAVKMNCVVSEVEFTDVDGELGAKPGARQDLNIIFEYGAGTKEVTKDVSVGLSENEGDRAAFDIRLYTKEGMVAAKMVRKSPLLESGVHFLTSKLSVFCGI